MRHTSYQFNKLFDIVIYCYILFIHKGVIIVHIIIQRSSMVPIYEQIIDQIKGMIVKGQLKAGDGLPSVRSLAGDLKISALTVKKAYDQLEEEGLTKTVAGKGSFVNQLNPELEKDEQLKEVQQELEQVIQKAKSYDISNKELLELFRLLLED